MNELRNMHSKTNSLEGVKEKYREGIIESLKYVVKNQKKICEDAHSSEEARNALRRRFRYEQYNKCYDNSLGSNDRWGIVARKNLFGLEAAILPEKEDGRKIVLRACSGRFQMQKFPTGFCDFFPNSIDISDILRRDEGEQFIELEEFYNMRNRDVFERFGVCTEGGTADGRLNLIANCLLLDSLLQNRYSEIKDIFCYSQSGYASRIELEDGTEIMANSRDRDNTEYNAKKGITIRKDGKEAIVDFDAISIGEKRDLLTNINDLEVENVVYTGDPELIAQLQQAMQEQFKSQQKQEDKKQLDVPSEPQEEKIGAQKIVEFMEENNLSLHDLSLALTMLSAKTTDQKKAEQHIGDGLGKDMPDIETELN